jgi:(2S)-methylsuccinyl-CoA dehydrogenase
MIIQASRQYTNYVAKLLDEHKGQMEATLIKFYASKISEWVTREAMQIHGGMGYAEEYAVSRYFVDARVFSIFEGAEEVMALRVIARDLLEQALKS